MSDKNSPKNMQILLGQNLSGYFFERLQAVNKIQPIQLKDEFLHYIGITLDEYVLSGRLFELEDGSFKNKVLGIKIMQSSGLSRSKRKKILKDVGDTALIMCGHFPEYFNRKLVGIDYYTEIGVSAYGQLNAIVPKYLNFKNFYLEFSKFFSLASNLISVVATENQFIDPRILKSA